MSDLGIQWRPFGARVPQGVGQGGASWPLRILPGTGALVLAGLLLAGLAEPRVAEPPAAPIDSPLLDAGSSIFGLEVAGFVQPPRSEAWTRRAGPGRMDALTFGEGPGGGDWLRLVVQQAGPLDPLPGSFYLDMARAAARAGVAVTRASLPDLLATRFGGFEVADVALAEGAGARVCLGFRLLVREPDLRILGFACGRGRQPDRAALACTLEGLRLLAPGADARVARFFAATEISRGLEPRPGCDAGRPGIKMVRRP
jgi:hypothetical protein